MFYSARCDTLKLFLLRLHKEYLPLNLLLEKYLKKIEIIGNIEYPIISIYRKF